MTVPHSTFLALLILASVLCTGCNGDVFLDGADTPQFTYATVDGDGGEETFKIQSKGLKEIFLDTFQSSGVEYYDREGNPIPPHSPASELGKIEYDNGYICYEMLKDGNTLIFKSIANPGDVNTVVFRLEYDYTVKFIEVTIARGGPMLLSDVEYEPLDNMEVSQYTVTERMSYTNTGQMPMTVVLHPLRYREAWITVNPSQAIPDISGRRVDMEAPAFADGKWIYKYFRSIPLGENYIFKIDDRPDRTDVSVGAGVSVVIYTDITYSRAQAKGKMIFTNEATERESHTDFSAVSVYPISYEIRVEERDQDT